MPLLSMSLNYHLKTFRQNQVNAINLESTSFGQEVFMVIQPKTLVDQIMHGTIVLISTTSGCRKMGAHHRQDTFPGEYHIH